jgi:hypothetical protein
LIHLGPGKDWSVPELGLESDSPFLVATWDSSSGHSGMESRALLGRDGSRTIWRKDTIRFQGMEGNGASPANSVWEDGRVIPPMAYDTGHAEKKADGLVSHPLGIREGLDQPGNYGWRCDTGKSASFSAAKLGKASFFLPAESLSGIRNGKDGRRKMIQAYRSITGGLNEASAFPENKLPFVVAYAAFVARVDEDARLKSWALGKLMQLDSSRLKFDSFSEIRSNNGWWYLTAYDLLSPMLTDAERAEVQAHLKSYVRPILENIPYVAVNATSLVLRTTVGLAGILLDEPHWVEMMVNHLDWYLDFGTREGIAYEGNYYLGVGFAYIPVFMGALNWADIGGPDFFADERYQTLVASLLMQVSPTWDFPCFEDCLHDSRLDEFISTSGRGFEKALKPGDSSLEDLASMCKWVEAHGKVPLEHDWLPDFPLYANRSAEPVAPSFERLGKWMKGYSIGVPAFVKVKGGSAILRNGWEPGSELFAISAKGYEQSHTHMDELSFELWALGENWISNPEYRGYGTRNHNWLTTTMASNSLTIDGHGQVNQNGGHVTRTVLAKRLQLIEASGSDLYRHPDRGILVKMSAIALFAALLMWFLILKTASIPAPRLKVPESSGLDTRPMSGARSGMGLMASAIFTPFIGPRGLKESASSLLDSRNVRASRDVETIGMWIQTALLGIILFSAALFFRNILTPFIRIYAQDGRYAWMRPILGYSWILLPAAVLAGFLIVKANYWLLESLCPKPEGGGEKANRLLRRTMRMAHADVTSMALIAVAAAMGVCLSRGNIHYALLGTNPDPWNFQRHLCSYLSRPILLMASFFFLKLALQILVARKYAAMLFFITGDKRWYRYGLASSMIAITFKKMVWVTLCLAFIYLLLISAGNISAETLTVYK